MFKRIKSRINLLREPNVGICPRLEAIFSLEGLAGKNIPADRVSTPLNARPWQVERKRSRSVSWQEKTELMGDVISEWRPFNIQCPRRIDLSGSGTAETAK